MSRNILIASVLVVVLCAFVVSGAPISKYDESTLDMVHEKRIVKLKRFNLRKIRSMVDQNSSMDKDEFEYSDENDEVDAFPLEQERFMEQPVKPSTPAASTTTERGVYTTEAIDDKCLYSLCGK
ncbi:uncharacterized protein LOC110679201 [Aedes aegypti]|uniref:Uncharacterized protein n=1 Tax=Aedes aegypti TaxID=7159 RepID=A0A6I8U641_AEDAE|nr:uncharacterized protein LOC110679201 [Aedes aegypti]